ncbi:MAG: rod-binding protein [Opitutaceae bacterium]
MNVSVIASTLGAATSGREMSSLLDHESRGATSSAAADRKKVSAQFEAVLVRQLLSKSVGSMLGGGSNVAGTVYGDMMTDALAQQLTAGQGLGLGRFIEKQLTPRGTPADLTEEKKTATAQPPENIEANP